MLNVYAASWCFHCRKTIEFLKQNQIDFIYLDIERQPPDIVQKVIAVNGGKDWVVPTLEYQGKWRGGKAYNALDLKKDLQVLGVLKV